MTRSVLLGLIYPNFVKIPSPTSADSTSKETSNDASAEESWSLLLDAKKGGIPPLFYNVPTSKILDDETGEPSLKKLNRAFKQETIHHFGRSGDSAFSPATDFSAPIYSYLDKQGDRIMISTNEAFKEALEEWGDDENLKLFVEMRTNDSRSVKSKQPSKLTFSLHNGTGDASTHGFHPDIICNNGIPSYDKALNLVAGLHKVHPSKVSLVAAMENECCVHIHDSNELLSLYHQFENKELVMEIAFSRPSCVKLSIGDNSFKVFGIGGILSDGGRLSFSHLRQVAQQKYTPRVISAFLSKIDVSLPLVINNDTTLTEVVYRTAGETLEVEVVPQVVLDPKSAILSKDNCSFGQNIGNVPRIRFQNSLGVSSWLLKDFHPGIYNAVLESATHQSSHHNYNFRLWAGVVTESKGDWEQPCQWIDIGKTSLVSTTGNENTYCSVTTNEFSIAGSTEDESERFVVSFTECQNFHAVDVRSITLHFVRPLGP
ncbi:hypothetical protein ACA910_019376 [Epithemia clementina (nom. ined.)]